MTGNEIRRRFLDYFAERGHTVVDSSSLIPANDPSLLWTAAGMVQFKPYFTGAAVPEFKRATSCQKCLRTPDIEEVGKTARHHTFFEMLGNFSFGDYFKEDAIRWAWDFLTVEMHLPAEKLWITIYLDDDEAFDIWHNQIGVPEDRIVRMGKDTNFWEIGVGPCGPCSEIHIDLGEEKGCGSPDCSVECECDRFLEIWNLVFIQFFKDEEGNYTPLKQKGIDTGMGLERLASVVQNVATNFDTDIFQDIMRFTADLVGTNYGKDHKTDTALKVIADHCRAIIFAINDGALPSNEGRGYVIRRLLRRAVRFGRVLGMKEAFLTRIVDEIIGQMGDAYPELVANQERIKQIIATEEQRFSETLEQGIALLNDIIQQPEVREQRIISGADAFRLYDTYGFPLELTKEIADEQGLNVDEAAFNSEMEMQRERARSARQETDYLSEKDELYKQLKDEFGTTDFIGYQQLNGETKILALLTDNKMVDSVSEGQEVEIIVPVTPCYAEQGGQVADFGKIYNEKCEIQIINVVKPVENFIVHYGSVVSGRLNIGDNVKIEVDKHRRMSIARNHSATHLLHKALKQVLGDHVNQAGSLVEPDRLRFDFSHYAAISAEDLQKVEDIVNEQIQANLPVVTKETTVEEAKAAGAMALFGEKYGHIVRMVSMGDFSLELCGGTHLNSTAEAGLCKILGESSIGSGVRRIEALTGEAALKYFQARESEFDQITDLVKVQPAEVVKKVDSLVKSVKEMTKELEQLRRNVAKYEAADQLNQVQDIQGVKVLSIEVQAADIEALRENADIFKDKLGSGVVVLGAVMDDKVNFVSCVSKDLLSRGLHAGKLIKEIAKTAGGGGGGRPDMAQAGGKKPDQLNAALAKTAELVREQLQ